jgi:5-methylcytosine-specific restriction enzyme A
MLCMNVISSMLFHGRNSSDFIFSEIVIFMDWYAQLHRCSPNFEKCQSKKCYFRLIGEEYNFFNEMISCYREWKRLDQLLPAKIVEAEKPTKPAETVKPAETEKRRNLENLRIPLWEMRFGKKENMGKCYLCGRELKISEYHISHIEPHSKGGSDDISNLEVLCSQCNLQMGNTNLYQYAVEKGFYRKEIKLI